MASSSFAPLRFDWEEDTPPTPPIRTRHNSSSNVRFAPHRDSSRSSFDSTTSSGRDKHEITVKFLAKKCQQAKWLEPPEDEFGIAEGGSSEGLGAILRRPDGFYTADPAFLSVEVVRAVERLGAVVAFTMSSEIVWSLETERMTPLMTELVLDKTGSVLPIARSVRDIGTSRCTATRESYVCYCRQEKFILIWASSVPNILAHGNDVETTLLGLLWGSQISMPEVTTPYRTSRHSGFAGFAPHQRGSSQSSVLHSDAATNEKLTIIHAAIEKETAGHKMYDPEKQKDSDFDRPFLLTHSMMIGAAMVLVVVVEMACVAKLLTEVRLDGQMVRLALVATIPLFATFSLFFMIVITGSLFQLFGPLPEKNSRFYSCKYFHSVLLDPKPQGDESKLDAMRVQVGRWKLCFGVVEMEV